MQKPVNLIVPASTSNLGPGFDTLGMALQWPLQLTATPGGSEILVEEEIGAENLAEDARNAVMEAVRAWEEKAGTTAGPARLSFTSDIPLARGLGSSACCRLATLTALNILNHEPLSSDQLLEIACRLEGHTDNAVASQVGGLTVSGWHRERIRWIRYPMPDSYRLVVLVPDRRLSTAKARSVLPPNVPLQDAVRNMQQAVLLVHALANNLPELLEGAFQDYIHQPFRKELLPFLEPVITAAEKAGAYGAFLSGSGSAVLAVTDTRQSEKVARLMLKKLRTEGNEGYVKVLQPDNRGLRRIDRRSV